MIKNLCIFIVVLCAVTGVSPGLAGAFSEDLSEGQTHYYYSVDVGQDGPYLDETVTIDSFWNKIAMFKFAAEKEAEAVLRITRLTPDRKISWGFVGINSDLYMLADFLSGPDTVFVREARLGKNNHVFAHLFGEADASLRIQVLPPLPPLPTITDFTVTPDRVTAGQGAVLTWSTLAAETVTIEPGIGGTTSSGVLEIAPGVTTLYMLTAHNSYGSTSASVRLEVLYPPEIIIIEPDGRDDSAGESFAIIWTDEDPDSTAGISLYYDTDSAGADGTLIISGLDEDPDGVDDSYVWDTSCLEAGEYYVYAVIDDGWNAPVTAYSAGPVTVAAAEPPKVFISADPEAIASGGSTTLSWTAIDADTCFIEPDVGPVEMTGSVVVSPAATTVYAITATGRGGTATDAVTVQVDCQLAVTITSPPEEAYISRPDILVEGAIENVANRVTSVCVNDMTAVVYGNRFVANHVPLEEGQNTITVTAEDSTGCRCVETRQVYADTGGHYIDISAGLESGLPEFTTSLYINGSFPVSSSSLDVAGPDTIALVQEEEDEYSVLISGEGIYILTAEAEHDGIVYTDRIALAGLNRETIDAEIKDVWDRMKFLLISNDREGALDMFHPVVRDHQQQVFDILADELPGIIAAMRNIYLVTVEDNLAEYRVERERIIQGQPFDITFYIVFSRTGQGWRIVDF